MRRVNEVQKDFYESRFETSEEPDRDERAANWITNRWTHLRDYVVADIRRKAGVEEWLLQRHREMLGELASVRLLDLGCFKGNVLSLELAERAGEYVGIDLSAQATAFLQQRLRQRGLANARAYAQDFLDNSYPDGHFDVVYAYSVLHHFEFRDEAFAELSRILRPGGIVVSHDPLMTDPLNRFARRLYRPFQSDKAWEWPFNRSTFAVLGRYFDITRIVGVEGAVKLSYPLLALPRLERLGLAAARRGVAFDERRAVRPGVPLYMCWHVSMRLRKLG